MIKKLGFLLAALAASSSALASFSQPLYQLRGTAVKPYYSNGSSETTTALLGSSSVNTVVTSSGISNLFGASYLDFTASGSTTARIFNFSAAGGNAPTTGAFSLLWRIVPKWTGNPATIQSLIQCGVSGSYSPLFLAHLTTASKIYFEIENSRAVTVISQTTTAGFSFTANTPTDIMITWDGTNAAGSVKYYQDGALVESDNPTAAYNTWNAKSFGQCFIGFDYSAVSADQSINFYLNELDIFNSVQAAYAVRSDFVSTSNLNGDTLPATTDVRSGTAVGLSTGSLAVPSASLVISPTAVDATTGTYVAVGTSNVRSGTTFGAASALTGTLAVPAASLVISPTAVDATTGTYVAVGTSNVKTGVTYGAASALTGTYDGSDRWTDPGIANVRLSTAYKANSTSNNRTGTAAIPGATDVRSGTATDATTGSLAVPAASLVISPTAVDAGTGTYVAVGTANVRSGTTFGAASALTGTLAVPSAALVISPTAVDATTGTYVAVGTSNVKTGVTYGAASALTGTYDGSDRWTDPGIANVRHGTAYKANSVSNNETGTAYIPAASDVRLSTNVDATTGTLDLPPIAKVLNAFVYDNTTKTGTLLSVDPLESNVVNGVFYTIDSVGKEGSFTPNYTDPGTTNVKHGIVYLADGVVSTGSYRGADLWSDPLASNVSSGVSYLANGVSELGTRNVVTNVLGTLNLGTPNGDPFQVSQGDVVSIGAIAYGDYGDPADLTGATLTTTVNGTVGLVTITDHVIDPDQTAHPGHFQIVLDAGVSVQFKLGVMHDIVTTATWPDGRVLTFHGDGGLNVLPAKPRRSAFYPGPACYLPKAA